MKVCFAATDKFPKEWSYISYFTELAALDKIGVHTLTTDPNEADLILFVDPQLPHKWTLEAIRADPLPAKYPDKTFIYNERDLTWCVLPGIYPSVLRSAYDARRQRSYSYFRNFGIPESAEAAAQADPPDLLFSFMGAKNHTVRRQVLALTHPRAYIEDTSQAQFHDYSDQRNEEELKRRRQLYGDVMRRSKFILCPRGMGASSFRIFETLRSGRVPVIVSDEWTEPSGPDWSRCSLRVRESEVSNIPAFLESQEQNFEQMSVHAVETYIEWFAPDVIFHRTIEKCEELIHLGARPISHSRMFDRQYVRCGFNQTFLDAKYQVRLLRNRLRNRILRRNST